MNIQIVATAIIALLLSACASPPPPNPTVHGTEAALAEASYSVSRSIVTLSEVAQASRPVPNLMPQPDPNVIGMGQMTDIDWSGPVEPLVKQLGNASSYRVRVLGREPAIPVLVTLHSKNQMLADVLRDVGYQCGRRANVIVYPEDKVIELRYAKN